MNKSQKIDLKLLNEIPSNVKSKVQRGINRFNVHHMK